MTNYILASKKKRNNGRVDQKTPLFFDSRRNGHNAPLTRDIQLGMHGAQGRTGPEIATVERVIHIVHIVVHMWKSLWTMWNMQKAVDIKSVKGKRYGGMDKNFFLSRTGGTVVEYRKSCV